MKGTLEDFAKEYGLELSIQFRQQLPPGDPARFYAKLNNVDIFIDGCLLGMFGDGPTPEAAVEDYAKQISEKQLYIISSKFGRLEIQAWEFIQNDNQTVDIQQHSKAITMIKSTLKDCIGRTLEKVIHSETNGDMVLVFSGESFVQISLYSGWDDPYIKDDDDFNPENFSDADLINAKLVTHEYFVERERKKQEAANYREKMERAELERLKKKFEGR